MANEADARRGFRTGKEEKRNFSLLRGRKRAEKEDGLDYYDYNLMAVVVLLTCFGLVMLYSTSAYEASVTFQNDMHYFEKQSLISIAAFVLMLIGKQVPTWQQIVSAALMVSFLIYLNNEGKLKNLLKHN